MTVRMMAEELHLNRASSIRISDNWILHHDNASAYSTFLFVSVSCKKDSRLLAHLFTWSVALWLLVMKMKMKLKGNHFEMIDNVKKTMNDYYIMTYHRIWLSRYVI